ncbi:DUF6265 family protein [Cesiribacter sp. SM1]|uniref:DUF6265 family protein n=1 Tax=Cesiribacter sp. SM1 TaxID=2861196 RepID=UPI001CD425F5|nr:DUF6265 family protein [Cesiribacter sp. SM1]
MIRLVLVMWIAFTISCKNEDTSTSTAVNEATLNTSENFDWLVGNWQSINEEEDRKTFETWNMKNDTEYKGFGFTLQNNDTVWQEHVRLVKSETGWNFEVTGKGESKPTVFKLTNVERESFACENQENEFPKKIVYAKAGNKIKAVISGGSMEIPFEFERAALK